MAAIEQHRSLAVGCGQLETSGGGLIGRLHFGNDTGQCPIAQAVLGHCQHLGILAALRVENPLGAEPDLFKSRRVKIEARECPQYCEPGFGGEACSDPGDKQSRRRIIAQFRRSGCDLMKTGPIKPIVSEPVVERCDSK